MKRLRLELALAIGLATVLLAVVLAGPAQRGGTLGGLGPPARCQGLPTVPGLADLGRSGSVGELAEAVEGLRGHEFAGLPNPTFLPSRAFSDRVREMPHLPEQKAGVTERVLVRLGAIPDDYDLQKELAELSGTAVAGYYEPSTGDLVIRGRGAVDGFSEMERLTLVHELGHALTDEALGFRDLEALTDVDEDAAAAYRALVEGDAQLITEEYASTAMSLGDQVRLGFSIPFAPGADVPHYLLRSGSFPYLEGADFVCRLYQEGGWEAVDAAYEDPPTTTAQILFPDRYLERRDPVDPADPGPPPGRWRHEAELALGAADVLFLLEAPGGNRAKGIRGAERIARGWSGGELHVWARGNETALSLRLVTEQPASTCDAIADWYGRSFPDAHPGKSASSPTFDGEGQDARLRCDGSSIALGIGPGMAVARAASR